MITHVLILALMAGGIYAASKTAGKSKDKQGNRSRGGAKAGSMNPGSGPVTSALPLSPDRSTRPMDLGIGANRSTGSLRENEPWRDLLLSGGGLRNGDDSTVPLSLGNRSKPMPDASLSRLLELSRGSRSAAQTIPSDGALRADPLSQFGSWLPSQSEQPSEPEDPFNDDGHTGWTYRRGQKRRR